MPLGARNEQFKAFIDILDFLIPGHWGHFNFVSCGFPEAKEKGIKILKPLKFKMLPTLPRSPPPHPNEKKLTSLPKL